jgi:hypothetical protein
MTLRLHYNPLSQPARMDLDPFANLREWLARIEARDSWKQTAPQR